MSVRILVGDCRERLRELADCSVDSVVCDPPYHLVSQDKRDHRRASPSEKQRQKIKRSTGFMGQTWDGGDVAFQPETWAEVLRVLKPGGHLVAFSGTRTYHRMAVAIEDAGFEVRDMIAWHYGSGFPKSHDVAKAITATELYGGSSPRNLRQARQVADYEPTGQTDYRKGRAFSAEIEHDRRPTELTESAREWQGWGTALKPATEPICLARKPLSEKSIAANVLKWGTGALNIDGCRIEADGEIIEQSGEKVDIARGKTHAGYDRPNATMFRTGKPKERNGPANEQGRWPANLCHDGSDEVVAGFPAEGGSGSGEQKISGGSGMGFFNGGQAKQNEGIRDFGDSGSAARFFYCAKATTEERGEGNNHPTVKPKALMRWLVRLVTPKGGTVLAADAEQFNFIGCELSAEYAEIARNRIAGASGLFADISVEMTGPSTRAA